MDYRILFPGKYLQSADFKGRDVNLTIKSIKAEEIEDKTKAVVGFAETKKLWVMNRTNAEALKLMWGVETDNWIGHKVTLYPAVMKDPFGDGEITAIRVRGAPDLAKAASATVQRGRKTIKVSVIPTGKLKLTPEQKAELSRLPPGQRPAAKAIFEMPAPEVNGADPETGEVPFDDEPPAEFESEVT